MLYKCDLVGDDDIQEIVLPSHRDNGMTELCSCKLPPNKTVSKLQHRFWNLFITDVIHKYLLIIFSSYNAIITDRKTFK